MGLLGVCKASGPHLDRLRRKSKGKNRHVSGTSQARDSIQSSARVGKMRRAKPIAWVGSVT